jgi:hypothetical protein
VDVKDDGEVDVTRIGEIVNHVTQRYPYLGDDDAPTADTKRDAFPQTESGRPMNGPRGSGTSASVPRCPTGPRGAGEALELHTLSRSETAELVNDHAGDFPVSRPLDWLPASIGRHALALDEPLRSEATHSQVANLVERNVADLLVSLQDDDQALGRRYEHLFAQVSWKAFETPPPVDDLYTHVDVSVSEPEEAHEWIVSRERSVEQPVPTPAPHGSQRRPPSAATTDQGRPGADARAFG